MLLFVMQIKEEQPSEVERESPVDRQQVKPLAPLAFALDFLIKPLEASKESPQNRLVLLKVVVLDLSQVLAQYLYKP